MAASGCGDREVSSPSATTQVGPSTVTTTETVASTATREQPSPSSTTTTTQPSRSTATAKQARPSAAQQIRMVTAKQIDALVDDNKGSVVVVNFWATWCPPCVREFPALIKAYEQYHGKGVSMFAVSMNSPEEKVDIEEFLQTHKPPFPIYLKDAQDATFNEAMLEGWFGEMPMTLVFDTAGKRVLAHTAEITFEQLSSTLEPLLPRQ
jgi:thiol-disulfide isomerase/thioredoxin